MKKSINQQTTIQAQTNPFKAKSAMSKNSTTLSRRSRHSMSARRK
jgi:hypothetical protein